MNTRSLSLYLAGVALLALFTLMLSVDRTSDRVKALDLRVSALERHIAAIHESAQKTTQHLRELTAAMPDNRWTLHPGISGMEVQVPVYITRPQPNP